MPRLRKSNFHNWKLHKKQRVRCSAKNNLHSESTFHKNFNDCSSGIFFDDPFEQLDRFILHRMLRQLCFSNKHDRYLYASKSFLLLYNNRIRTLNLQQVSIFILKTFFPFFYKCKMSYVFLVIKLQLKKSLFYFKKLNICIITIY